MDDVMEDGELLSSSDGEENPAVLPPPPPQNSLEVQFQDDILDDSSYVIVQRPKSSLPIPAKNSTVTSTVTTSVPSNVQECRQGQQPSSFESSVQAKQQNANLYGGFEGSGTDYYEQFGRKAYYDNAGVADLLESSDKESSSASDSDDERFTGKRSRMTLPTGQQSQLQDFNAFAPSNFGGMLESGLGAQAMDDASAPQQTLQDFFTEAANFQKQRKPNLVWSNVIQEEEISKGLGFQVRVGGGHREVEVTRGPETYFFQRADRREPRRRRASDSSDISSEGLSDNALHYLKDGIDCDDEETEESSPSKHSLPTSFTSSSASKKTNKRRRTSQKHKRKIVNKLKRMKSFELSKYMAEKLKEEKVQLLTRAVEILGKDTCIHIFLKTLKIEKRGGVMTKTQERRRTPGGVFLYLIRGDRRVPKSHVDNIFREDRAVSDKFRKKKMASKRLRKKAELESVKATMEQEDMKLGDEHSESQSDSTAVSQFGTHHQGEDGTDTGHYGDDSTQESSAHSRDTAAEELSGFVEMQFDG